MAQAWVRMTQWPSFKWNPHQSSMAGILLEIEQRTFFGLRGITPSPRSFFIPLQWQRIMTSCRYTSILQLFKCSEDNFLLKWDITHDANGYISMTSPYAPFSWVGADITGSIVPVPWRLIPADRKSYYLTTDMNPFSQNPRVPAAKSKDPSYGSMATLKEGDQWQMWEFIHIWVIMPVQLQAIFCILWFCMNCILSPCVSLGDTIFVFMALVPPSVSSFSSDSSSPQAPRLFHSKKDHLHCLRQSTRNPSLSTTWRHTLFDVLLLPDTTWRQTPRRRLFNMDFTLSLSAYFSPFSYYSLT